MLEQSLGDGAAALLLGKNNVIAEAMETYAFMTDTPDFWRREHEFYPQHGGRFTGEPAYFRTIMGAANGIMKKAKMKAQDFKYVIFHQPNGKFPMKVGQMLGFKKEQIEPGWLTPRLGNTYSGSSPLGLTSTLDISKPGEMILMVSYGSGAGSDAFVWRVTDRINEARDLAVRTTKLLDENQFYVDYGTYAKYRHKILKNT